MATTPFIHDVPAAEALAAWRAALAAAGCPERVEPVRLALADAVGRVTAAPVWATRSSPSFDASAMDGIAVRAADTVGASESTPVWLEPGAYAVLDTGDPLPEGFDAVVMREHVHYDDARRAELRGAVAPYQHVRSIGEDASATELLLPAGHRLRPVDVAAAAARSARAPAPPSCGRPGGTACAGAAPPPPRRPAPSACSPAAARWSPSPRPATRSARPARRPPRARSSTRTRSCWPPRPRRRA